MTKVFVLSLSQTWIGLDSSKTKICQNYVGSNYGAWRVGYMLLNHLIS